MNLTEQNLPLAKISSTTVGDKVGFSIGGFWLNGSDAFKTKEELHAYLMGKELSPSKSGKSLVVIGAWTAPERDVDFVKSITVKRTESYVPVDLNDFI